MAIRRQTERTASGAKAPTQHAAAAVIDITKAGIITVLPKRKGAVRDHDFSAALQQVLSSPIARKKKLMAQLKGRRLEARQPRFGNLEMPDFAQEVIGALTTLLEGRDRGSNAIVFRWLMIEQEFAYSDKVKGGTRTENRDPIKAIESLDLTQLDLPPIPPEVRALEAYIRQVQAGPRLKFPDRVAFVNAVNSKLDEAGYRLKLPDGRFAVLCITNYSIQIQPNDGGSMRFKSAMFELRPYKPSPPDSQ
jgi:hypothetical protein